METQLPEPWEHSRGYYLNADGKSIKYENSETGFSISVEAMLNEDDGCMEYAVWVQDTNGDVVTHPPIRSSKSGAWKKAREFADEYAE